ncbi:MAG: cupin domain-containing protein [Candidatus Omnitrophica bacterium]|jgi:quercetin dioxygenase-like cupin family protein|nr:cupin domain-containing protein [Candidatus Omnitrophota bacterium]
MARENFKKNIIVKVLNTANSIAYEKNSIVSNTIVKKKSGTITLFSFDCGQGLSEHTAPFDALIYIIEGRARIYIAKKPYKVSKDKMIILPANKPHAVKAITKFKMMLVMIKSK